MGDKFDKEENKKFIKISYIVTDEKDTFFESDDNELFCKETYINIDQIVEISDVEYEVFSVKKYDGLYTAYELKIFTIYLSDGRKYFLKEAELYKFKSLMYE